jgi:hypothetical protein
MRELAAAAYGSVADVTAGLDLIERRFRERHDRRGVFATAYLHITRSILRRLDAGGFEDPAWVRSYLVAFANLYREALLGYEAGAAVPKAWRMAFDVARAGTGLVVQHLVLGINAHINHDLALALVQCGIDPGRAAKYRDHTAVNDVLAEATAEMKRLVAAIHAPVLHRIDRITGRVDDDVTNFSIPRAREHAWTFAVALAAARTAEDAALLRRALDEQAAVIARLVLASPTRHPVVLTSVRVVERVDALLRRVPLPRR